MSWIWQIKCWKSTGMYCNCWAPQNVQNPVLFKSKNLKSKKCAMYGISEDFLITCNEVNLQKQMHNNKVNFKEISKCFWSIQILWSFVTLLKSLQAYCYAHKCLWTALDALNHSCFTEKCTMETLYWTFELNVNNCKKGFYIVVALFNWKKLYNRIIT